MHSILSWESSNPYFDHITDFNPADDVIQLPHGSSTRLKSLTPLTGLTQKTVSDAFIRSSVEANETILFEVGERVFIVGNDSDPDYSATDDILIELTGVSIDSLTDANFVIG